VFKVAKNKEWSTKIKWHARKQSMPFYFGYSLGQVVSFWVACATMGWEKRVYFIHVLQDEE